MKRALLVILLVLLADQALKIHVKTHFVLGSTVPEWTADGKAYLMFVENTGMAFGMKFGGVAGKLALTLFRIIAVVVIGFIMKRMIAAGRTPWMITSLALIFAGALGNIIDSAFYGLLFDKGTVYDALTREEVHYAGLAVMDGSGYAPFLHGAVVDMFYFPLWRGHFPGWLPIWGSQPFEFFRPVFNIADAAISVGVAMMILVQRTQKQAPAAGPLSPAAVAEPHAGGTGDPGAIEQPRQDPGTDTEAGH